MHNQKKQCAVVFGLTSNLTFALASVLFDLKKHSPHLADEAVILHDGISAAEQILLHSIFPCRFIPYDLPPEIQNKVNPETLKIFTKMVFSKFECLRLLNEYKNVIMLDYDILITKDISELITFCPSGIKMIPGGIKVREQLFAPVSKYNMDAEGICASTFVVQDHLKDYPHMLDFCYQSLVEYGSVLRYPEQAIFDFMLQNFSLQIQPLTHKIYTAHPREKEKIADARILHAFGQPKFWNGLHHKQWNSNYRKWLKMGGSAYTKAPYFTRLKKSLKTILKQTAAFLNLKTT